MQNTPLFIFTGRSGCGKGTQGKLLEKYLNDKDKDNPVFYIETGVGVRKLISGESFTSIRAKEYNKAGKRQPSFIAVSIWSDLFINQYDGKGPVIIDGSPRTDVEAKILETAISFYGFSPVYIFYLETSVDIVTKRMIMRGRADDTHEDIKKRLEWYERDVVPAENMYKDHPEYHFIEINGEGTIEEVHAEVIKALNSYGKN